MLAFLLEVVLKGKAFQQECGVQMSPDEPSSYRGKQKKIVINENWQICDRVK
jgi:hypothetical protein